MFGRQSSSGSTSTCLLRACRDLSPIFVSQCILPSYYFTSRQSREIISEISHHMYEGTYYVEISYVASLIRKYAAGIKVVWMIISLWK